LTRIIFLVVTKERGRESTVHVNVLV